MLKINWTYGPHGFLPAMIGMRYPMDSNGKNDTRLMNRYEEVGPNDVALAKKLALAGRDHAKYRRQIVVWVSIDAPLYWWKEFDTYRFGVEKQSGSTMHTIQKKEFTNDDFSCEHLFTINDGEEDDRIDENTVWIDDIFDVNQEALDKITEMYGVTPVATSTDLLGGIASYLNTCRENYLETNDKKYWWQMIQLLPSCYNQRREVMLSYEALSNIYHARKNHKLDEWHTFCDWIEDLPHAKEMIFPEKPAEEKVDPNKISIRKGAIEQLVWYLAGNNSPSDISEFLGIPDSRVKDMLSDSNREDAKDDDKIDWMQLSEAAIW